MTPGRRASLALACVVGVLTTSGCGLKGPLYLPEPAAKPPASAGTSTTPKPGDKTGTESPH